MSYYRGGVGVIANDAIKKVEQLQVKIFTELKERAIAHKEALPEKGREAYIQGFCRAVDSIIEIINTDLKQQEILEQTIDEAKQSMMYDKCRYCRKEFPRQNNAIVYHEEWCKTQTQESQS